MAKKTVRRSTAAPPEPATRPPTTRADTGWNISLPRGIRPKVNPPVDRHFANLADADERALYTGESSGARTAASRRVSQAALDQAQKRMQGGQQDDDDDLPDDRELDNLGNEDAFEPNGDEDDQSDDQHGGPTDDEILAMAAQISERRGQQTQPPKQQRQQQATTQAAAPTKGLNLQPIAVEDTDRLWDWIRADAEGGFSYFSRPLKNSQQLHDVMRSLVAAEQQGTGLARSVCYGQDHIGFAALVPILDTEKIAVVHLYLNPAVRGSLDKLLPWLLGQAYALLPGYQLAIFASDEARRRLYRTLLVKLEFAEHSLFVR